MPYRIVFYKNFRGREPVAEFIDSLNQKTQQKIASYIGLLKEQGPFLRRPYADKIKELYELRIRFSSDNIRILYFFFLKETIVLLHVFRKKDWEIDSIHLKTAENRMDEITNAFKKGKCEI